MVKFSFAHVAAGLMLLISPVLADDVKFTLVEKNASYQVGDTGQTELVHFEFVSETLLAKEGMIHGGTIKQAGQAEPVFTLKESTSFYNRYADEYQDFGKLDKEHPNTEYIIDIEGSDSSISDLRLTFHGPEGKAQLPDIISIRLWQSGTEKAPALIDPGLDLKVVWSEFSKGDADPQGVMDDLVFAMVNDCHGNSVSRSGIPFIMPDYYTFRNTHHVVPAGKLQPGYAYTAKVIHVNGVDTRKAGEAIAMATYNTSTTMGFRTIGENTGPACPKAAAK